ncbi:hypothetical protein I0C86_27220 [Plantactinospora sp. S1510]|uniref:Uncharacterized protein n=1 Tax=Plantactinospora alkalitolerans TaxID=2789879 RepID=A0ABS0H2U8_9ACTN|nr:hypothetical protein [Plantactinospora alkalitolerans]MBF9132616.1 hypothetical protein [Plantactinospora alkalitolerans]
MTSGDAGLIEIELDGLIHRYIRTTATRNREGTTLTVYNYDGEVAPGGGESGSENAAARVASPLATRRSSELPTSGTTG